MITALCELRVSSLGEKGSPAGETTAEPAFLGTGAFLSTEASWCSLSQHYCTRLILDRLCVKPCSTAFLATRWASGWLIFSAPRLAKLIPAAGPLCGLPSAPIPLRGPPVRAHITLLSFWRRRLRPRLSVPSTCASVSPRGCRLHSAWTSAWHLIDF